MITTDLQRTLTELADVISQMDDLDLACELACERLEAALHGPVAILERSGSRWRLRSSSGGRQAGEIADETVADDEVSLEELTARAESVQWAWIPLGAGEERVMLVPANWHPRRTAGPLEQNARQLGFALEAVALRAAGRERGRMIRASYGFTRRLSAVSGRAHLHQFIVDEVAEASRAKLGALALYSETEGCLHVAATRGYPRVLVQDVRVAPGEGVIGRVFRDRRPLLVSDIRKHPNLHRPRPRYRTPSFMAIPVLAQQQAIGVLCLADRFDGAPFEEADLAVARSLAASASLALSADALAQRAEVLGQWATIDPLTELFNRRYFRQRLEEEFQRSRRYHLPLSLVLFDLDDFKRVNDTYGHPAGDVVLRSISDVLRRTVRAFDVCCRYGGEEFVVVLPGSDADDASTTAHRVRLAVESHRVALRTGEAPVRVTLSAGCVSLGANDTVDDLIGAADEALYEAKQRGKNQIRVARSTG